MNTIEAFEKDILLQDFTRCSLCGSCVEACKFDALEFSKEYNLASTRKEDFHFDLLQRLEDRNK